MQIFAYFCGKFDYYFTDTDDELVEKMCALLDDPENDTRDFELEDGTAFIVRPSGTEPKIKVYILTQGADKAECEARVAKYTSYAEELSK